MDARGLADADSCGDTALVMGMHFIEADLMEDWLESIDWDTIVGWILIFGRLTS
jgi:hypothetical protein